MGNLFIDNQTHYEFFDTADGSPSICLSSEVFRPEAMHHRQGALAESLFVYHGVLIEALQRGCPPSVLSVGLGCGYNEMITVAHFIAMGASSSTTELYIESFEGDTNLRIGFANWLIGKKIETPIGEPLFLTFEKVAQLVSENFRITPEELKMTILKFIEQKQFVIREWLNRETKFFSKFGVIYFDAFSGKSTPELWNEQFLTEFLAKTADQNCGLATYAATGALNRALKKSGFTMVNQTGFSGKRESTRAFRIDEGKTLC